MTQAEAQRGIEEALYRWTGRFWDQNIEDEYAYLAGEKFKAGYDIKQNGENDKVQRLMKVPSMNPYPKTIETVSVVMDPETPKSRGFLVRVESPVAEKALREWAGSFVDWKPLLVSYLLRDKVYGIGNGHRAKLSDDGRVIEITELPEVKAGVMNSGYTVVEKRTYEDWEFVPPITATNFK